MNRSQSRTVRIRFTALSLAASLGIAGLAAAPASATSSAPTRTSADREVLQPLLDAGYPGALVTVSQADGSATGATGGVGNRQTDRGVPLDGHVRIGSNTKTFVAVVVLQLVEEGKINLDDPVDTHLPGLLTGDGIDGTKITVRQLLQHTSGLPEYTDETMMESFDTKPQDYWAPHDLVAHALTKPAQFEPGAEFRYTNTNYLVLGMLVEKVAHRTVASQIHDRIAEPLGLTRTYLPAPGDTSMPNPHPRGYHREPTPSELNTFMQAILDGRLLKPESITEMQKTVPAEGLGEYGLGLIAYDLKCGTAWGHGGGIPGYMTNNAALPDGPAATVAVTALPASVIDDPANVEQATAAADVASDALEASLCH